MHRHLPVRFFRVEIHPTSKTKQSHAKLRLSEKHDTHDISVSKYNYFKNGISTYIYYNERDSTCPVFSILMSSLGQLFATLYTDTE